MEPLSVKIRDAAALLGVKDNRTVYKLIESGKIKARKINKKTTLVSVQSIRKFLGDTING